MNLYQRIIIIVIMGAIPKRCVVDLRSFIIFLKSFFNKHADTLLFLKVFILYKNRFLHF